MGHGRPRAARPGAAADGARAGAPGGSLVPGEGAPARGRGPAGLERVRDHAKRSGIDVEIRRYPRATRTAADAAAAIGCAVAEIVKSLVFLADDAPVVVLVSGADRVDERRLAAALGATVVRRATADEVRALTGYAIGGVPPFAYSRPCAVICDAALQGFATVWAAAGLPDAVFPISPGDLVRASSARVAAVATGG